MVQPQLIKSFMSSHSTLSGKKGEYITNSKSAITNPGHYRMV